jgi:hypothetical protein
MRLPAGRQKGSLETEVAVTEDVKPNWQSGRKGRPFPRSMLR